MKRLERLTSNHESRRGPAPDEVSWALEMLREAEQEWMCSEKCVDIGRCVCGREDWLAKLREEAKP